MSSDMSGETRGIDGAKARPVRDSAGAVAAIRDRRGQSRGGDALRSMEWSELTARLNAARELRDEAILCAGTSGARFGDAAAGLYNGLGVEGQGGGERPVNPDGLESRKTSGDTWLYQSGDAPEGDARDEK